MLKTYDPVSGACLKYKTDKAAEVGRLVAALGKCGRVMSGLPVKEEADTEEGGVGLKTEVKDEVEETKQTTGVKDGGKPGAQAQGQGKGGGGGGKKKKGKR